MKREILFRGRYAREKAWVYGSLIAGSGILDNDEHGGMLHPIDFNTVGQYTGLKDKNGKKIFEGDIVRFKLFDDVLEAETGEGHYNIVVTVEWISGEWITSEGPLYDIEHFGLEVIGNIYDNPELIGGDEC